MEDKELRETIRSVIKEVELEKKNKELEEAISENQRFATVLKVMAISLFTFLSIQWIYFTISDQMTPNNKLSITLKLIVIGGPLMFGFLSSKVNIKILKAKKEKELQRQTELLKDI